MRSKLLTLVTLAALAALVVTAPAQDGATPFRAAQVVGGGFDRFDLTCDLNLDGHVDYIGGWQDQVQWYENHGNHGARNLGPPGRPLGTHKRDRRTRANHPACRPSR